MTERYNGWKNYQTWNVALWFANDETLYRVQRAYFKNKKATAANVQEFVRGLLPDGTQDLNDRWKEEMGGTSKGDPYGGVAWGEIARSWNEE